MIAGGAICFARVWVGFSQLGLLARWEKVFLRGCRRHANRLPEYVASGAGLATGIA